MIIQKYIKVLSICILLVFQCIFNFAYAWDGDGHKFIAALAWKQMTPQARELITTLLKSGTDSAGSPCVEDNFVKAARWLDCVRKYKVTPYDTIRHADHYPVCPGIFSDYPPGEYPHESSPALKQAIKDIYNPNTPINTRRLAAKIILHLVGDLHQPMHTATTYNKKLQPQTRVKLANTKESMLLHRYWDRNVAQAVIDNKTAVLNIIKTQDNSMQSDDVDSWLKETRQQALDITFLPLLGKDNLCTPSDTPILITKSYEKSAAELGILKIAQASVRMAYIFNKAASMAYTK